MRTSVCSCGLMMARIVFASLHSPVVLCPYPDISLRTPAALYSHLFNKPVLPSFIRRLRLWTLPGGYLPGWWLRMPVSVTQPRNGLEGTEFIMWTEKWSRVCKCWVDLGAWWVDWWVVALNSKEIVWAGVPLRVGMLNDREADLHDEVWCMWDK